MPGIPNFCQNIGCQCSTQGPQGEPGPQGPKGDTGTGLSGTPVFFVKEEVFSSTQHGYSLAKFAPPGYIATGGGYLTSTDMGDSAAKDDVLSKVRVQGSRPIPSGGLAEGTDPTGPWNAAEGWQIFFSVEATSEHPVTVGVYVLCRKAV